ncbi:hypothetical protein FB45DRAFT_901008 [Roridomyces roridus]|uniref:F-box domain-containing protein n=1 Tax=Roridomyces roridus TaxID=1738132 RepID=A0AAD7CAA9_9AGAR|nr:hypothetical protein FB45DRAFT_901008 [Roridomyces roridus]
MANFSPEIFQLILNELKYDPYDGLEALLNLRLVSKTVNAITIPLFFSVLLVRDDLESARAVSFLQRCDESIRTAVREVVFEADNEEFALGAWKGGIAIAMSWRHGQGTTLKQSEALYAKERTALTNFFSRLSNFPNLRRLRFNFYSSYEEGPKKDPIAATCAATHFLRKQNALLEALAKNPPPPLTSLVMTNLIGVHDDVYHAEEFQVIFRTLKRLEISVLSNPHGDFVAEADESFQQCSDFWEFNLSDMVRNSTSLTSLTLGSDDCGAGLHIHLRDVFLPQLSELVLHNFILDPSWAESDLALLATRHKNTLSHLELHGCSVRCQQNDQRNVLRPWHAVFELFEAELSKLRRFVFLDDQGKEGFLQRGRFLYTVLPTAGRDPTTFVHYDGRVNGEELDLPAFKRLVANVELRLKAQAL